MTTTTPGTEPRMSPLVPAAAAAAFLAINALIVAYAVCSGVFRADPHAPAAGEVDASRSGPGGHG